MTGVKYIGTPPSWVMQPESFYATEAGERLTVDYLATDLSTAPAVGSACTITDFTNLKLVTWSARIVKPGTYRVTVEYGLKDDTEETVVVEEWEREDGEKDMPLEASSNYRTIWNHYLVKRSGATSNWTTYASATNVIVPQAYENDYRWVSSVDFIEDDWFVVANRTKDEDFYRISESSVVLRKKYWSRSSAESAAATTIAIDMPTKTLGISGGTWLRTPGGIRFDGKYWVVETRWTNNQDGYDTDLYS